jgi:hypothetical protein
LQHVGAAVLAPAPKDRFHCRCEVIPPSGSAPFPSPSAGSVTGPMPSFHHLSGRVVPLPACAASVFSPWTREEQHRGRLATVRALRGAHSLEDPRGGQPQDARILSRCPRQGFPALPCPALPLCCCCWLLLRGRPVPAARCPPAHTHTHARTERTHNGREGEHMTRRDRA